MARYKTMLVILASAVILTLMTSTAIAIPSYTTANPTNALETVSSLEFVNVVAGIGTAIYQQAFVFGGNDGSGMAVHDSSSGLSQTSAWLFSYSNFSGFQNYLTRLPVSSPNGISLMLVYPATVTNSFTLAGNAKALFDTQYGINLNLVYFSGGSGQRNYYVFNTAASQQIYSQVASDTVAMDSSGFSGLMNVNTLMSAPCGWAGYGARNLGSGRASMQGMGWINPNGLTVSGSTYTLSLKQAFGTVPTSRLGFGLSRVSVYFPYPITPSSISPTTSNPLPQVTGRMIWDLRHPIQSYDLPQPSDFLVTYTLSINTSFPNIQNQFTVNETKLNTQGILDATFNLKNIGGETANNIKMSFPLGPDFNNIIAHPIKMYTINPLYSLNTAEKSTYNVAFSTSPDISSLYPGLASFNFQALNLTGWYDVIANGSRAFWDSSTTTYNLISASFNVLTYGTVSVQFSISGPQGFPTYFLSALNTLKSSLPAVTGLTSLTTALNDIKTGFPLVLRNSFNDSLHALYDVTPIFQFDNGTFDYVSRTVAIDPANTQKQWFLEQTIPSLAPGKNTSLSFHINNIPISTDTFSMMHFSKVTDPQTGYSTAVVTSSSANYYDLMQYIFEIAGFSGRPISHLLTPNSYLTEGITTPVYGSLGATFTYENPQGFKFFGLSNGQNLQIGDDEAVISSVVQLNQQVYNIGDPVHINVTLSNTGDLPATSVVVHLYHGILGRSNQMEQLDPITNINVGTLNAGANTTVTWDGYANTYLGYHTVFAIVDFVSDTGQGPHTIPDFFGLGITQFSAAGETRNLVMSTLSGALLIPKSFKASPSIPQPIVTIKSEIINSNGVTIDPVSLAKGDTFTLKLTLTNKGNSATTVGITQSYDTSTLKVDGSVTASKGTVTQGSQSSTGYVKVSSISLAPGENATVEIPFQLIANGANIPSAYATYSVSGESTLGTTVNTGVKISISGSPSALSLSADAAAQQQSTKSGSADASADAFSASSSVGASAAGNTGGSPTTIKPGKGFLGPSPVDFMAFMVAPLAIIALIIRKRK